MDSITATDIPYHHRKNRQRVIKRSHTYTIGLTLLPLKTESSQRSRRPSLTTSLIFCSWLMDFLQLMWSNVSVLMLAVKHRHHTMDPCVIITASLTYHCEDVQQKNGDSWRVCASHISDASFIGWNWQPLTLSSAPFHTQPSCQDPLVWVSLLH